jgi:hypothetical protein
MGGFCELGVVTRGEGRVVSGEPNGQPAQFVHERDR